MQGELSPEAYKRIEDEATWALCSSEGLPFWFASMSLGRSMRPFGKKIASRLAPIIAELIEEARRAG